MGAVPAVGGIQMKFAAWNCCLALFLLVPGETIAAPSTSAGQAAAPDSERYAVALELANTIVRQSGDKANIEQIVRITLDKAVASSEEFKMLDKAYPDLRAELAAAWLPLFIENVEFVKPKYAAEIAELYAKNLTIGEVRENLAFWKSAAGQALSRQLNSNLKFDASLDEIVKETMVDVNDQSGASTAALERDRAAAVRTTIKQISPEARLQIMRYSLSPAGRKIVALNPQRAAIDAKWFNATSPEVEAKIQTTTIETIAAHIARVDAERAGSEPTKK